MSFFVFFFGGGRGEKIKDINTYLSHFFTSFLQIICLSVLALSKQPPLPPSSHPSLDDHSVLPSFDLELNAPPVQSVDLLGQPRPLLGQNGPDFGPPAQEVQKEGGGRCGLGQEEVPFELRQRDLPLRREVVRPTSSTSPGIVAVGIQHGDRDDVAFELRGTPKGSGVWSASGVVVSSPTRLRLLHLGTSS